MFTSEPSNNYRQKVNKHLEKLKWFFDFTASVSFENYLLDQKLYEATVFKGVIADKGQIGLLLKEGDDRNPRIDDLKIYAWSKYSSEKRISDWLIRENKLVDKTKSVNVGVGCNTETTILEDDSITLHSASIFKAIKSEIKLAKESGSVHLTLCPYDDFSISSISYNVEPFLVLNCNGWEVRIKPSIDKKILDLANAEAPNETGGVLIGLVNKRTRCIHIIDILEKPADSEYDPFTFIRGKEGLKDKIDWQKEKSGNTFGYVGEWHSHPNGPEGPSAIDMNTMHEFKALYEHEDLDIPVLVIIATTKNLIPVLI